MAVLLAAILLPDGVRGQQTGEVRGTVFTLSAEGQRILLPAASVEITPRTSRRPTATTLSDAEGSFLFFALTPGNYRVSAESRGMSSGLIDVTVSAGVSTTIAVELKVNQIHEEVTVGAQSEALNPQATQTETAIQESTITNAPNVNERFDSLLPLIPGVVRGPDGLIKMKGARTSQSAMLVNSSNVTDPVTGAWGINLPIDVVSSVQVQAAPYDPEFGKLTGGVATLDTRVGDFEKYHVKLQNFMPRLRKRDGTIAGIESSTPRMTVTGPIRRGRLAFLQSFEYRYVRTPVESLPPLQRDTVVESFDSYTQIDANLTENQTAAFVFSLYPQKLNYLGLNTFTPQPATPNLHQRGYLASFTHKYASQSGALLVSQFSRKEFDANVTANATGLYQLGVDTTFGGYYNRQDRDTARTEWRETYHLAPRSFLGQHQLKIGTIFDWNSYDGLQTDWPVEVLGATGAVARRIDFTPASRISITQREYTVFALDQWSPVSSLTFDVGLRLDRDSISDTTGLAPRLGFAFSPAKNGRTVVRGGVGLFYDRVNLNVASFLEYPQRTVTQFNNDGAIAWETQFIHRLTEPFRTPRSLSWNLEVDHQLRRGLVLRTAYNQRNTVDEYVVRPDQNAGQSVLWLAQDGSSHYRELEVTGVYNFGPHTLNASYVRSKATGNMNDFSQFFGNTPQPLLRADEYSRLSFDAPNRVIVWGEFHAPFKTTWSPVVDWHTGFPYSIVDENRDFVGEQNAAGRFPDFASVDLQVTKEIRIPVRHHRFYKAHVGVRIFNLFNHFNPRDLQNNVESVHFGTFYNGVGRMLRGKFVLEF